MPLQPEGRVARRGNLVALVRKAPGYRGRPPGAVEVTLARITGLTRDGEIRSYRPVAPAQDYDVPVERYWQDIEGFTDASNLDPDRAIEIARAHTWPGHPDAPRPWESLEDARRALRAARRS
ncbi:MULTISPECIES: hypothetical protein [Frankia]|nr:MULTISPECIES: hypothetical protein [Frankia]